MNNDNAAFELDIITRRISKIWRQANHPGTSEIERQAFEAKALALMDQHRIQMAQLDITHDDPLGDVTYGWVEGRYAPAVCDIINAIAQAYGARMFWKTKNRTVARNVFLFGFKSDCDRTTQLARMLIGEAQSQASLLTGVNAADTYRLRRDFQIGFASAIKMRLKESLRLAYGEVSDEVATSTALVFVDRKTQVDNKFALRRMRTNNYRPSLGRGWVQGNAAGHAAALGTQKPVSAAPKALGK